jgi:transcriptional regulator with XRE-family HTH domain
MTLAEWMSKTGATQVELSEATGIQQPLISKYLRKKQRPNVDNALAIERATKGAVPVETWERKHRKAA